MAYTQISDMTSPAFAEALTIYEEAFPANERHPLEVIKQRIEQRKNQLFVGQAGNEVASMALLWPLQRSGFTLLDYLATKPSHRGQGWASAFLRETFASLKAKQEYLLFEVEDPSAGRNKDERAQRLSFYRRMGARELTGVRYILPPLQGNKNARMRLLISPNYQDLSIAASLVQKLVTQLYRDVYGRDRQDPLLNSFLPAIRDLIQLS